MRDLVPFGQFVDQTRSARFGDYAAILRASAKRHSLQIDAEAEFRRMKDYVLDYYHEVHPVRSILGADGHPVDCVPLAEQPGARLAAHAGHTLQMTPPAPAMPDTTRACADAEGSSTQGPSPPFPPSPRLDSPPVRTVEPVCPDGTVPLRRITLESLVRCGSLNHYLRGVHTAR